MLVNIKASHTASRGTYGSPRVHRDLVEDAVAVGRHRVARLMRQEGLRSKRRRRYRVTTNSDHRHPVAANVLERDFTADAENCKWAADITYVWTRCGWLYLAVVLDLYSRRVVGWAMSNRITRELALNALSMALTHRPRPELLVHHSDRGSQYASADYRREALAPNDALRHRLLSPTKQDGCSAMKRSSPRLVNFFSNTTCPCRSTPQT